MADASIPQKDTKRLQVHQQTRLCKFFVMGKCTRGQSCAFAHGQDKLRQQPDFSKTRLCADFMELGSCAEGEGDLGLLCFGKLLCLCVCRYFAAFNFTS